MSADIYQIIQRLAQIEEGQTTPVVVKKGLNPQQQSVPQLPALFKPQKISALTSTTDPQHPTADYFVGEDVMNEADVSEDLLDKARRLGDYLDSVEQEIRSRELQQRQPDTREVQKKSTDTGNLKAPKAKAIESAPVKTITLENGRVCEIHGDEGQGFAIRHSGRDLKSRFEQLEHAVIACEMFNARLRAGAASAAAPVDTDYIEER
jgi:hypothetical protein